MNPTCPTCRSEDPNLVGVLKTGAVCTDPFHCPSPDIHGNPFRFCPHCNWSEDRDVKAGTVTVRVLTFDTEEALHGHAERLNERGDGHPDVAIMDAKGIAVLASRTAPGGDGRGFAYYAPCEDGFMHCANPDCCGDCADRTWKPTFPVTALAVSSRFPSQ